MADWVTISALATAGGTLVLAGTTYASVRSANRASRVAELSLMAGLRPLLVTSSDEDPVQRAGFGDSVSLTVPGGGAAAEVVDGRVYLAISLRNVGPGIGVLHDPDREAARALVEDGRLRLELPYGDYEGGQRVVTRFGVARTADAWTATVVRHWQVDRPNPR